MSTRWSIPVLLLTSAMLLMGDASADDMTWTGGSGNDWFDSGNWTNGIGANGVPGAGDTANIASGSVLLTNETAALAALNVTGGTLTFSNWMTKVTATTVDLRGGTLTLPDAFTDDGPSNRVWVVCTDFTLGSNAVINTSQKGFHVNYGPGTGTPSYAGAGHGSQGGYGAVDKGGPAYGSLSAPEAPGSGGHYDAAYGGKGGGAVRIHANGTATIFGAITANAGNSTGTHRSGGSGGSIYITCNIFAGSPNGRLQANGGYGRNNGGRGAGGRIAVAYDTVAQAGQPNPGVRMQTLRGTAGLSFLPGEDGTTWLPDARFLSSTIENEQFEDTFLHIPNFTNWTVGSLTLDNAGFVFGTKVHVVITNQLEINGGELGVTSNGTVQCGSLVLTNSGVLSMYSGPTNGSDQLLGSLLSVAGSMHIGSGSWVYPYSDRTNGGSPKFEIGGDLTVASGGGFNADYLGFKGNYGPGKPGASNGGGGYGGYGGAYSSLSARSPTYGSLTAPTLPGSGGGPADWGGAGGGLIWIEATNGAVTIYGTLTANGRYRNSTHHGSGGGGGIFVHCKTFDGDNGGLIRANGANCSNNGGNGGGGRIAVVYDTTAQAGANPQVRFQASRGINGAHNSDVSRQSEDGTLYLPDASFLSTNMNDRVFDDVEVHIGGNFTNWTVAQLTIDSCDFNLANTGLVVTVSNTLLIRDDALFGVREYSTLSCGNITLEPDHVNGDTCGLRVFSGATNGALDHGALVEVRDLVSLPSNAWIYPYSDMDNGGSPLFRLRDVDIALGGGFSADLGGFKYQTGPGGGRAGGGGYGGDGGEASPSSGGQTYGREDAPTHPGSGGYHPSYGGSGGGLVHIEASGTFGLGGTLKADGGIAVGTHGGGGSGGGVFLKCTTLDASDGSLLQVRGNNGNNSSGSGGGGGRIAVWRFHDVSTGTITTNAAAGYGQDESGEPGTAFFVITAPVITNLPAANVTKTHGDMVGHLTSTGYYPTVIHCYWGETDAEDDLGAWSHTNDFGVKSPAVLTNSIATLAEGTVYHYRFYATNHAGEVWAAPTRSFSTLGGGVTVENRDPTAIAPTSATLVGAVTAGNPAPTVILCWGDNDGGAADTNNWDHHVNVGEHLGEFALGIGNLLANKTYFYRCYAANTNADDWSDATTNFATAGPYVSIADTSVTEGHSGTKPMAFMVSLSATSVVDVSVNYASSDGTAEAVTDYLATNGTVTIPSNQLSGTLTVRIIGDTEDEFPSQSLFVDLSSPSDCQLGDAQAEGTITDDDAAAETNTWTGTGNWYDTARWSKGSVPRDIDTAVLAAGDATIDASDTVSVLSIQDGATLSFTNWDTILTASNIVIEGGGTATALGPFDWTGTATRVHFVCTNLVVATNGVVNVDGLGFVAGMGYGQGHGTGYGSGAGHGGPGGGSQDAEVGGSEYDSTNAPMWPGGGGGEDGGAGGGAVRINASGTVTVFGTITASGHGYTTSYGGGGAGGSVHISCRTFAGSTNGLLRVNGGRGYGTQGGSGAGGRIAVVYDTAAQAAAGDPNVRMQGSPGSTGYLPGDHGSVYFPDATFLSTTMGHHEFWHVKFYSDGFTNWALNSLALSNCSLTFGEPGFVLDVAGDITIDNGGLGIRENGRLTCGGNLTMANASDLWLHPAPTNVAGPAYGCLVAVTGLMHVGSGCAVYPYSDDTNGASVCFNLGALTVDDTGEFDADWKGFRYQKGPGALTDGSGGGYGGRGNPYSGRLSGGPMYGDTAAPALPGSGGGTAIYGGSGGGLIWIHAPTGTVSISGTLSANGEVDHATHAGAGGGGGIFITCKRFEGSNTGLVRVNGANSSHNGGAGGGGRIAVVYEPGTQAGHNPRVRFQAAMGIGGYSGGVTRRGWDGTLYLSDTAFLSTNMENGVFNDLFLHIPGFTSWALDSLTLDNVTFAFGSTGMVATVTNAVSIQNSGGLTLRAGSTLDCGSLTLSNGTLSVYAAPTNGDVAAYGALVDVRRDMWIATDSWVYAYCDMTNGGAPLFLMKDLTVDQGGGFNADGAGFMYEAGPGLGGEGYGGAGYGGVGGKGNSGAGGPTYGITNAPVLPGSGGQYSTYGGAGGGAVRIEAEDTVTLYGTITANGERAVTTHGAGGSGGGILVSGKELFTANSTLLRADGKNGDNSGGGGGGGRIAIWTGGAKPGHRDDIFAGGNGPDMFLTVTDTIDGWAGTLSVTNGTGIYSPQGQVGTTVFLVFDYPPTGTIIMFR